jgi:hypothetical protein
LDDYWDDEQKKDISELIKYSVDLSLNDFITNLILVTSFENDNSVVDLSTFHSSKGLEWDNVFIIGMDSDFPKKISKPYNEEIDDIDEERRTFYVGATRAKENLDITFVKTPSTFINNINEDLYYAIDFKHRDELILTGDVLNDIRNYLEKNGINIIQSYIHPLQHEYTNLYNSKNITSDKTFGLIIDYLICKMLINNFKIERFNLKTSKKIMEKFYDIKTDWRDCFDIILKIIEEEREFNYYLNKCNEMIKFFEIVEVNVKNYFKNFNEIKLHVNLGFEKANCDIDIIADDVLIDIKAISTNNNVLSCCNIIQIMIYGFIAQKKNMNIKKIGLFDVFNGDLHLFDISNIDLKKTYDIIYK